MKTFAPEFSQQWLAVEPRRADEASLGVDDELPSPSQQEAWKVLVERVKAARSTF